MKHYLNILLSFAFFMSATPLRANQSFSTQERFKDVFITAGYATLFGTALGAAVMGLSADPRSKSRYLIVGASTGFIVGGTLGTYLAFSPIFTNDSYIGTAREISQNSKENTVIISPVISEAGKITAIQADWLAWKF